MELTALTVPGCPNAPVLKQRLADLIAGRPSRTAPYRTFTMPGVRLPPLFLVFPGTAEPSAPSSPTRSRTSSRPIRFIGGASITTPSAPLPHGATRKDPEAPSICAKLQLDPGTGARQNPWSVPGGQGGGEKVGEDLIDALSLVVMYPVRGVGKALYAAEIWHVVVVGLG
jgi:hypothetical protein